MHWKKRRAVEIQIVHKLLEVLIEAGFEVSIDYQDDEVIEQPSNDLAWLKDNIAQADEEYLLVYEPGKHTVRSILLVYGNDGYDVIADYSCSLASVIKPAEDFAATFEED